MTVVSTLYNRIRFFPAARCINAESYSLHQHSAQDRLSPPTLGSVHTRAVSRPVTRVRRARCRACRTARRLLCSLSMPVVVVTVSNLAPVLSMPSLGIRVFDCVAEGRRSLNRQMDQMGCGRSHDEIGAHLSWLTSLKGSTYHCENRRSICKIGERVGHFYLPLRIRSGVVYSRVLRIA